MQSLADTVGASEAPRIPWCRDERRRRLYDLFARVYDFIVLLSGGPSSFHSLPGLGAQRRIARVSKTPIVSIVDDDASVCAAMQSLLRSHGFVAFAFYSAEDFLRSP